MNDFTKRKMYGRKVVHGNKTQILCPIFSRFTFLEVIKGIFILLFRFTLLRREHAKFAVKKE
jgi:hypothetical protein